MGKQLIFIAVGSAFGGVLRFLISKWMTTAMTSAFPYGTLVVNLAGCFLIGLFYGIGVKHLTSSPTLLLFLTTGFCGGFTTFSAFGYENLQLLKNGAFGLAAVYIAVSVIGGLALTFLGFQIIKSL
jgi:fluoride exporter